MLAHAQAPPAAGLPGCGAVQCRGGCCCRGGVHLQILLLVVSRLKSQAHSRCAAQAEGLPANGSTVQSVHAWLLRHCKVKNMLCCSTQAVCALTRSLQVSAISLGPKGCSVADSRQTVTAAAERVHVEDTIGAGDNFCAGFLTAHLAGASLQVSTAVMIWLLQNCMPEAGCVQACAECGCAAGTAAVQCKGGGLTPAAAKALRARLAGILASTMAES